MQLPTALIVRVLSHVPQQQRLSQCALVSRAWAGAATEATVHVDCLHCRLSGAALEALEAWVQQYAAQIQTLKLVGDGNLDPIPRLQLPWDRLLQLQCLELDEFELLGMSSNSTGGSSGVRGGNKRGGNNHGTLAPTALLPRLKQLRLSFCHFDQPGDFVRLASSPLLTNLAIGERCKITAANANSILAQIQLFDSTLDTLLQNLSQVVVLHLPTSGLHSYTMKQTAAMHNLQDLQLAVWQPVDEGCFAALPTGLTALDLLNMRHLEMTRRSQSTLPAHVPPLRCLRKLVLRFCSLSTTALLSKTQLQHLSLKNCDVLPSAGNGVGTSAAGAAALLDAVQRLSQLEHLELGSSRLYRAGAPAQKFLALTASTRLTNLVISEVAQVLPPKAAQHMLAGRQLSNLRTLKLMTTSPQQRGSWCLDTSDLSAIIGCCPQLEELDVCQTVRTTADLSVLRRLPASLRSLHVGGEAFADSAVPVVLQHTQLTALSWTHSHTFSDRGLLQLTALHNLRELFVSHCGISKSIWQGADWETVKLESSDRQGPVWRQLKQLCMRSLDCVTTMLDEERADHDVTRQQLADREAEVQQLQQELADSEAHRQAEVEQLQQQLAALSGGRRQEQL